jgi:lipopolysaccharide transport system permease protein
MGEGANAPAPPALELSSAPAAAHPDSPVTAPPEPDLAGPQPILDLGPEPDSRREWLTSMWRHRGVIWVLGRQDFHVRFKRATFGVLWAVAVPALQAAVLVVVFSHFVHTASGIPYGAYVVSGILPWSYFVLALPAGVTAIVEGTGLTDKVWFPRAILPLVPCVSGLAGLAISMVLLLILTPILGAHIGLHLLLLIPACMLLVAFTAALALLASALQVYFRDVRFIVSAALLVWLYATPIMYPQSQLGHLGPYLDFNPMTGVISLFHLAVLGGGVPWQRALIVSLAATLALLVAGVETQRRRDRRLVDLL